MTDRARTWAGLPKAEQTFDRYRARALAAAAERTEQALRAEGVGEFMDEHDLALLAGRCAAAALRMPAEQADLFGTQGRLVARLWRAMDELRWEIERVRLDQAIHQHSPNGDSRRHP